MEGKCVCNILWKGSVYVIYFGRVVYVIYYGRVVCIIYNGKVVYVIYNGEGSSVYACLRGGQAVG